MGWTSYNMRQPIKDWFKDQWNYEGSDYEALDSSLVKYHTLYGAVRQKSTGDVFAVVFLIQFTKGYHNFSYKDMTEFAGPCEHECPEKIFKLLTPLNDEKDPNGWARNWRKKVEDFHQTRKRINNGELFKTKNKVHFHSDVEYQYFRRLNDEKEHRHSGYFKRNGNRFCAYKYDNGKYVLASKEMVYTFNPHNHLIDGFIKE